MGFTDFYMLTEAGLEDRIAFLAKKYTDKWNLHWQGVAVDLYHDTTFSSGGNSLSHDFKQILTGFEREGGVSYNAKPNFYQSREIKDPKVIQNGYAQIRHYYNELQDDHATYEQEGAQSNDYKHTMNDIYDQIEILEPMWSLGAPMNEEYVAKEFTQIAMYIDPMGDGADDMDNVNKIKPIYTEWIILELMRGTWDSDITERLEDIYGRNWKPRDWRAWEEGGVIKRTLEKFHYYIANHKKELIEVSKALEDEEGNTGAIAGEQADAAINDLQVHGRPKDPTQILQYKVKHSHGIPSYDSGYKMLTNMMTVFDAVKPKLAYNSNDFRHLDIDKIPGVNVVASDDKWVVFDVVEFEGVNMLCTGMGWCIESESQFRSYIETNFDDPDIRDDDQGTPLYLFTQRDVDNPNRIGKVKYLIHVGTEQAKARFNESMDKNAAAEISHLVDQIPDLKNAFEPDDDLLNSVPSLIEKADYLKRLIADGEWRMVFQRTELLVSPGGPQGSVLDGLQKMEMLVDSTKEALAGIASAAWKRRIDAAYNGNPLTGNPIRDKDSNIERWQAYQNALKGSLTEHTLATILQANKEFVEGMASDPDFQKLRNTHRYVKDKQLHHARIAELLLNDILFIRWSIYSQSINITPEVHDYNLPKEVRQEMKLLLHSMLAVLKDGGPVGKILRQLFPITKDSHRRSEWSQFKDLMMSPRQHKMKEKAIDYSQSEFRHLHDTDPRPGVANSMANWNEKWWEYLTTMIQDSLSRYGIGMPDKAARAVVDGDGTPIIAYAFYRANVHKKVAPVLAVDPLFVQMMNDWINTEINRIAPHPDQFNQEQ